MLMNEETRGALNNLLTKSFALNMICDNLVYQIDYNAYVNIASIFHESFAHVFPQKADEISDLMIKLNALPIRGNLDETYEDFGGNLEAIFAEVNKACKEYRNAIVSCINVADMNDDFEVKIKLEEFLQSILPYVKQADVWETFAKRYANDYKSFDTNFKDITKFIEII